MKIDDHMELISIWEKSEGLCIDEEDSFENMQFFLKRNRGLSYVAILNGKIIATIKGAQDGRRGYISHLTVLKEYRGYGVAKALLDKTTKGLMKQGIFKCNLYVLDSNIDAIKFWNYNGWKILEKNFSMMQKKLK